MSNDNNRKGRAKELLDKQDQLDLEEISLGEPIDIKEAKHRGKPIGGSYSVIKHTAHSTVGQTHYHFYDGPTHILAVNQDRTRHDGHHGERAPNKIAKYLRDQGVNLKDGNIVEAVDPE
jgi:hypothetical protein